MANRFQKLIYYLSAETPILVVLALAWALQKSSWVPTVSISWQVPGVLLVMSVIMTLLFTAFFRKALSELSIMKIEGSEFKCVDGWLAAYVVTYLLPLASLLLGDVAWIVLGVVLVLLMLVLVFSDHVTPHPLLFCKGYHFYELKVDGLASDYKVISKKQIRNAKDIKKVSRVFEFLLIRTG